MRVVATTSFDEDQDPQNIFTSDKSQFWMTTGMFPQEIVISIPEGRNISDVQIATTHAKRIIIEGCENQKGNEFKKIAETGSLNPRNGMLQMERIKVSFECKSQNRDPHSRLYFLKIVIAEGYDDFVSVHQLVV